MRIENGIRSWSYSTVAWAVLGCAALVAVGYVARRFFTRSESSNEAAEPLPQPLKERKIVFWCDTINDVLVDHEMLRSPFAEKLMMAIPNLQTELRGRSIVHESDHDCLYLNVEYLGARCEPHRLEADSKRYNAITKGNCIWIVIPTQKHEKLAGMTLSLAGWLEGSRLAGSKEVDFIFAPIIPEIRNNKFKQPDQVVKEIVQIVNKKWSKK